MSEVKVNKISPRSGTGVQLGDSGDTITIPSGATINNQGTAVNFGATGSASWITTVKTGDFTAVAGEGYFVNTTSGEIDVTLPAGSAGDVVAVADYANTADTNNIILKQNGSDKIEGSTDDFVINQEGAALTIVFVDSTKGWIITDTGNSSDAFVAGPYAADFLVIAGGGAGGYDQGGGGGAGGYRASFNSETSGGGGSSETALTFNSGTVYTITVGGGGAGINGVTTPANEGVASSISGSDITDITTIGGGRGGNYNQPSYGASTGGSGGGGAGGSPAGLAGAAGTTNQGYAGGSAAGSVSTGTGGGGAGAVGVNSTSANPGAGGAGVASTITGSSVTRGGGGGSHTASSPYTSSPGGAGGGGAGSTNTSANGNPGTANTGSGGGGIWNFPGPYISGAGGSGVVILRVPTASYSGTTSGSPTISTNGSDTIMIFNGDGSYTA